MPRKKSIEQPHYELLFIVSNKYTEEELSPIIKKVKKIIEDNEGKITHEEDWGKRKFAYPIKHFQFGYYILIEFDANTDKITNINKTIRIADDILRHNIVVKEMISEKEKLAKKKAAKKREEEITEPKEKPEKIARKEKVDLKKLDEKLDKILETDDLL